jgi:hypothetical protein
MSRLRPKASNVEISYPRQQTEAYEGLPCRRPTIENLQSSSGGA